MRFTGLHLYRLSGKSGRRSGVYACLNACDIWSAKQNPTRVPPCRFRVHPITQQKLRRPVVQPLIECPSHSSLMGRHALRRGIISHTAQGSTGRHARRLNSCMRLTECLPCTAPTHRLRRAVRDPRASGSEPVSWLLASQRPFRLDMRLSDAGMVPERRLSSRRLGGRTGGE